MDAPSLLFVAALLASVTSHPAPWLRGAFAYALYSLLVTAAFFGATRERMQTVGEWAEDRCGLALEQRSDPFFGPSEPAPPFFSVLDDSDKVVAATHPTHVFFGPRMEFLYARDRLSSPRGFPSGGIPEPPFPSAQSPPSSRHGKPTTSASLSSCTTTEPACPPPFSEPSNAITSKQPSAPPDPQALNDAKIDVYTPRQ